MSLRIRDFALDPRYIEEATMEPGMIEEDAWQVTLWSMTRSQKVG